MRAAAKRIQQDQETPAALPKAIELGADEEGSWTPERTRRSFVMHATLNRRSRSKTAPMIVPVGEDEKAPEEGNAPVSDGNVRRTVSAFILCFRAFRII